ncbi:MAG: hypothetical protein SGI86_10810 [Deltaproteobacteria bacterium]|nr:hypothetical protein [Deltaproteobacteria bacterium]
MTNQPFEFSGSPFNPIEVGDLARELLASDNVVREGHTARTLAKSQGLTVVLAVVRAGGEIREHAAPGPVTIVPIMGAATFTRPGDADTAVLGVGRTLFIVPGQKHHVTADCDSAFLIIIGAQS